MELTSNQRDRAAGVLVGQAIGDALGVPYEFGSRIEAGGARMIGGGLGPYRPGEYSDDTQMGICIGHGLRDAEPTTSARLDAVAREFLAWQEGGASDIGIQTSAVLSMARRAQGPLGARMQRCAAELAATGRAGNGALMRTGIVGLAALDDRERTAELARAVAALTHADQRCLDAAVLWSEAMRVAVVDGCLDIRAGLDLLDPASAQEWADVIGRAEEAPPGTFAKNGFVVTAFQAAWSAIHATRHITGPDHVTAALQQAVAIGHDTDTVAAIAGSLLGARYGYSGLPSDLVRRINGWPGYRARDLVELALGVAGQVTQGNWPAVDRLTHNVGRLGVPHPDDPDVLLGTQADLDRIDDLPASAVVSLSRVGKEQTPGDHDKHVHVEAWLVDSEDPTANPHLAWALTDVACTIRQLRAEGHTVLLHCVAAHHRTPAVALAYSTLLGRDVDRSARRIQHAVGHPVGGLLWETALDLGTERAA